MGATGFIGRRLCHRITAEGGLVTALVRPNSPVHHLPTRNLRRVVGDLTSGEGLPELVSGADVVLHLGGVTSALREQAYWAGNAVGSGHLARSAAALPVPPVFVYCSSLAAAGPAPAVDRPRTEEDAPTPVSAYGRSKLAGERAVREFSDRMPVTVIRPPAVYGPGDAMLVPSVLPMIRARLLVSCGRGERRFSLIHVDDLCTALLSAAARAPRARPAGNDGVYFVSDGVVHTWESFAVVLASAIGRKAPHRVSAPAAVAAAVARAGELAARFTGGAAPALTRDKVRELTHPWWTCSDEKARRDWGFHAATGLREGLGALCGAHDLRGLPGVPGASAPGHRAGR
ncbi:NAD-dependent epimerase/dehydratase family protein [Streptomyces sp. HMX87]|uniref:NAD-dependent epimerase/dehydratase family protein n=1 Tax=Streptomyces sp. HMX87 TaxID=3390849 RepID=UPI003A8A1AAB